MREGWRKKREKINQLYEEVNGVKHKVRCLQSCFFSVCNACIKLKHILQNFIDTPFEELMLY